MIGVYFVISISMSSSYSGPADVELSNANSARPTVKGLHIDESVGSPTIYEFMLTVVDYRNLTDNDTVFVIYRKGILSVQSLSLSLSPSCSSPPLLFSLSLLLTTNLPTPTLQTPRLLRRLQQVRP